MIRRFRHYPQIGGKRDRIPADCVEVDYIRSTGSQYVNLDFGFDPTDEIDAEFSVDISQTVDKYIVSPVRWNTSQNKFAIGVHTAMLKGEYCAAYGNIGTSYTVMKPDTVNDGRIHRWTYSSKVFSIVDLGLTRECLSISFGATTQNLRLFYGYASNTIGRIAHYKHIKMNGVGVDLVAVRCTTDGLGYLCDRLTGKLYGNTVTGDGFPAECIGPDKK